MYIIFLQKLTFQGTRDIVNSKYFQIRKAFFVPRLFAWQGIVVNRRSHAEGSLCLNECLRRLRVTRRGGAVILPGGPCRGCARGVEIGVPISGVSKRRWDALGMVESISGHSDAVLHTLGETSFLLDLPQTRGGSVE